MDKHLHIVTHDVPWPVAHGGFVDLYYKIVALHKIGVKIHLHCFHKPGRQQEPHLEQLCEHVYYYKRIKSFSFFIPYIVYSRKSIALLRNLNKDDHPILLEGTHSSLLLNQGLLNDRKVIVRLHNIEHLYYGTISLFEKKLYKKIYYAAEKFLLKRYEETIASKATFLTVSSHDAEVFGKTFKTDVHFLPVFLPAYNFSIKPGTGTYCLYHGNLCVNENEEAVSWLIKNIFSALNVPFVIAGRSPSVALLKLASRYKHIKVITDPDDDDLQDLIRDAHVNILPSFNITGVKLKVLNALHNSRHCLVNEAAAKGNGVEELCVIAKNADECRKVLPVLMQTPFTEDDIAKRKTVLTAVYNNEQNAHRLMTYLR